uniref:Uncharacterized protein n=1 Tax=Arundo donax TaxID=35708 RepID=A0A0A8ZVL6_ARUDO
MCSYGNLTNFYPRRVSNAVYERENSPQIFHFRLHVDKSKPLPCVATCYT